MPAGGLRRYFGMTERVKINIHGIVQGVGFRPFIHRLVLQHDLRGYIKNTSSGVEMELEGEREALERFTAELPMKAPKLAVIEAVETEYSSELKNFEGFEIRSSKTEAFRNTLISPDICICDDCLHELMTPGDRRYRYPFINCTNCGPRFTIIKDVPYDRAKTSMSAFPMCPDCDREYRDIENRRYHAQPDACPVCGPEVEFVLPESAEGAPRVIRGDAGIEKARQLLKAGKIVAVKGLGGMHLACRCDDDGRTASELRRRKQRDEKPFAIMCRDVECARRICRVSAEEEKLLTGFRRPIVLLRKLDGRLDAISENRYVGVMLPYTPLHYLLFGNDIDMLVMTSANLSDTPIIFRNSEALESLSGIADGFLLHNRDIQTRCDDSLCSVFEGKEYFLRRSRGYVPFPVKISVPGFADKPPILACGAEQKASFCLSRRNYVFPSQHIGDLKNLETFENYEQQIDHFEKLFDICPEAVAFDLHPDYMSTGYAEKLAEKRGIKSIAVQHHHAHMASCMADNNLDGEVIGLIWDGTGLGADGTIWGAECLTGGYGSFERSSSIRPIPLIGGDKAVKELGRVAFALAGESGVPFEAPGTEYLAQVLGSGINCPLSSGAGRLFDGVSALLGIKNIASYEGQGAVLVEAAADPGEQGRYETEFYEDDSRVLRFDWRPMIRQLAAEKAAGEAPGKLAAKFMNTLISMAAEQCRTAREKTGLDRVVLSGGSFQNMYIMNRLPGVLRGEGFKVYHHSRVSCNDEGLSLGQVMICAWQCR